MRSQRATPLTRLAVGLALMMVYFALSSAKPASIVKARPVPRPPQTSGLVCVPNLNFGQITIGQTSPTLSYICTNMGTTPVQITNVCLNGACATPIPPNPPSNVKSIEARRHQ